MLGIHLNKTNIKLNKEPSLLYHESHFCHPSGNNKMLHKLN